jgi:hypothetical protein
MIHHSVHKTPPRIVVCQSNTNHTFTLNSFRACFVVIHSSTVPTTILYVFLLFSHECFSSEFFESDEPEDVSLYFRLSPCSIYNGKFRATILNTVTRFTYTEGKSAFVSLFYILLHKQWVMIAWHTTLVKSCNLVYFTDHLHRYSE